MSAPPPCSPEPDEILSAARNGDNDAFVALVIPLVPNLHRLARRMTKSQQDADDVCQESILKAYTKLPQFTEMRDVAADDFRSWLMKITVNSAIDFNRRNRARKVVPLDDCELGLSGANLILNPSRSDNPEGTYVIRERARMVARAAASLPERLRQAWLLRYVRELSVKEVAARMGISANAVRSRAFRAHRQLRKNICERTVTNRPR